MDSVPPDMRQIKGVAFHTFFQALAELRGSDAAEQARAALPSDIEQRLRRGGISRVGHYPLQTYNELHAAAQRALGGGDGLARAIGKQAAEIDTRGLLRFVLGLASADLLMRHADKVWSSFVRGSRVSVQKLEPQRYAVDFEGFADASALVLVELEGGIEGLLEQTGALEPTARRTPGANASVRFVITWAG